MQGEKRLFQYFKGLYSSDKDPSSFKIENKGNNNIKKLNVNILEIFNENKEKIFKRKNLYKP